MSFKTLAVEHNQHGKPRRVGFEFEFGGVEVRSAAECVKAAFGGELESKNRFAYKCKTSIGDFDIKIDADMILALKHREFFYEFGIEFDKEGLGEKIEEIIEKGALIFVPCEVVTPPLLFERLEDVERLRVELEKIGAKGTGSKLHYAFGLHINIGVPDLSVKTLLSYLRAYFLMREFIKEISEIDLTRRLTPFIDPFPNVYVNEVLDVDFKPNIYEFMKHYFKFNPTRNREFDMTPIFGVIDKELTLKSIKEPNLLKPREAFHYRLPNCSIGEEGWSVELEWNRFVLVEHLAHSPNSIRALISEYKKIEDESFFGKSSKKIEMIKAYLSRK